jgi:hypothetical protein
MSAYAFTRSKEVQPEIAEEEFRGMVMSGWQKQARATTASRAGFAACLCALDPGVPSAAAAQIVANPDGTFSAVADGCSPHTALIWQLMIGGFVIRRVSRRRSSCGFRQRCAAPVTRISGAPPLCPAPLNSLTYRHCHGRCAQAHRILQRPFLRSTDSRAPTSQPAGITGRDLVGVARARGML